MICLLHDIISKIGGNGLAQNMHNSLINVLQLKRLVLCEIRMLVPWRLHFYQLSSEVLIKQ